MAGKLERARRVRRVLALTAGVAVACGGGGVRPSGHEAAHAENPRAPGLLPQAADPFDPAACTGAPIADAEMIRRFAPGATEATLGRWVAFARTRSCNQMTGCGRWSATRIAPWSTPRGVARLRAASAFETRGIGVRLHLEPDDACYDGLGGARCDFTSPGGERGLFCQIFMDRVDRQGRACYDWIGDGGSDARCCASSPARALGEQMIVFSGLVTHRCGRLTHRAASAADGATGAYVEQETVLVWR